jgi:hypothetical protein
MTATQELEKFLAKYDPAIVKQAKAALTKMREITPGAVEMVYDNYNALVIGFGPTEKAGLAIFSIVLYTKYLNLFFLQGVGLPDPAKRLQGQGNVAKHVRLDSVEVLDEPEIRALMKVALERAKVQLDPKQERYMVIKSVSKKQRPRSAASKPRAGRRK